ncbi:MAG: DUF1990 domain-containing protein [Acidobacteria bacterium]|nr:DUF1990 domain-containing protein [Acidobacteriota bacterium]
MFLLRRPSQREIDRFLRDSGDQPLSYRPVGLARAGAPGFSRDECHVCLGKGSATFNRAARALEEWRQFDLGWTEVFPRGASTSPGTTVAVLIRHLGFWSLNGAQIVYAVGGRGAREFGYAYGTLPSHAERGEEIFKVTLDPETNEVIYHLLAASKPRAFLAVLGYPIVRALQARFRRHSAAAMTRAVV